MSRAGVVKAAEADHLQFLSSLVCPPCASPRVVLREQRDGAEEWAGQLASLLSEVTEAAQSRRCARSTRPRCSRGEAHAEARAAAEG